MGAVQWGNVSEWISGGATSIAVSVALATAIRTERSGKEQLLSTVFAWTIQADDGAWALVVSNNTNYPLYSWRAELLYGDASDAVDQSESGILPPGRYEFPWVPSGDPPDGEADVKIRLTFRDALGRTNVREPGGRLRVRRLKRRAG